jgi:hypothetical protein
VPNPCPPYSFSTCQGPFRTGLALTLPDGYTDKLVPPGSMFRRSEVGTTLGNAFDALTSAFSEPIPGVATVTEVFIGSDYTFQGWSEDQADPSDPPPPIDPLHWVVQTYVYAPAAPSDVWLDYVWLAQQWVSQLTSTPLPDGQGDIQIQVTETTYQTDAGRFLGVLPAGYRTT